MITFQTRKSRNCVSANCLNRNYKPKPKLNESKENENDHNAQNQQQKQNFVHEFQNYKPPRSCVDLYTQQMKFLVDQNADYFQSKMRITDKVRPNQYRFKIPTKTPMTLYKKHYNQKIKDRSVDNVKLNRNLLSQTIKTNQSQQKLMLSTTYQVNYLQLQTQFGLKNQGKRSKKNSIFNSRKSKEFKEECGDEVPRFLETQNNRFFLNWGGYNSAISLKPSHQSIVTNLPFDGKTTYKNDFQGKMVNPSKTASHQSTISKFKSPFLINKSSYSRDFTRNERRPEVERNCKPQHELLMTSSTNFKGCTQYRSQFMKLNEMNEDFSFQMDKNDLKTLIMDI